MTSLYLATLQVTFRHIKPQKIFCFKLNSNFSVPNLHNALRTDNNPNYPLKISFYPTGSTLVTTITTCTKKKSLVTARSHETIK